MDLNTYYLRRFTIIAMLMFSAVASNAQDTIAGWTFPTGTNADANPDLGVPANASMTISAQGGTSAIDFSKNGFTTKSAQATGWDGGANLKYWQIEVNTTGYENIKLYSKQTSGGTNPGPRDYKAQYKIGSAGTWTNILNTTIITANNWTSGVLTNVSIPPACDNQSSVFIRWIMTSDTSSAPPALVLSTGTSKIDDIFILGTLSGVGLTENFALRQVNIYPNPCKKKFFINIPITGETYRYEIYSADGHHMLSDDSNENLKAIYVEKFPPSVYYVKIIEENITIVKKVLILK